MLINSQYRGQRFRSRYRHCIRQDRLGSLCADHKQPRGMPLSCPFRPSWIMDANCLPAAERWLRERCPSRLSWALVRLSTISLELWVGNIHKSVAWEWRPVLEMVDLTSVQHSVVFWAIMVSVRCRAVRVAVCFRTIVRSNLVSKVQASHIHTWPIGRGRFTIPTTLVMLGPVLQTFDGYVQQGTQHKFGGNYPKIIHRGAIHCARRARSSLGQVGSNSGTVPSYR